MAKKSNKRQAQAQQAKTNQVTEAKSGNSLKDLLNADMLDKLKQVDKNLKADIERKAAEEEERRRREAEEREKNKSFADLLAEYDKKGTGKYS
ncbi:DUF3886 domain-containing protein [Brevibacillus dissolubilis]|uniref:DUF3886 domain-containing protein n=1 Tax=Brevibacillus dissolubilis TaxID=1844116 RepID=UPI0011178F70|nr:DUF3886 domain-containing protein [Brevibacillus dissolubilis]